MDLINRFRVERNAKIALVGSGGKTTLMFQLAREFTSRVILTTTTHLALDQLSAADTMVTVKGPADVPGPGEEIPGRMILFTGPEVEPNRVSGPDPESLAAIHRLAESWDCPLIIEADGARKLPIKAPAPHEPPIPAFVDLVFTVIGLSGLGKPLTEKWVHRPEIFSSLVNLPLGGEIESQHVVAYLISEQGGLKNIPSGARRILLINQVDAFPNWKAFHNQLDSMLSAYHMVAFAVLEDEMLLEVHHRTAGILLAGGGSTRFGQPKQLLDWGGKPLVRHVAEIAREAGLNPLLVVTGSKAEAVARGVDGLVLEIVHNPQWEEGQSTSVRAGVDALPDTTGAAVFLLVDQPLIAVDLIHLLRMKHAKSGADIVCPEVGGQPGNPVLFDRRLFKELSSLQGDRGGKSLFDRFPPQFVSWEDARSQLDIDSPDEYSTLLSSAG
jgi:molybdenum cofactor cytidylyltransferase